MWRESHAQGHEGYGFTHRYIILLCLMRNVIDCSCATHTTALDSRGTVWVPDRLRHIEQTLHFP